MICNYNETGESQRWLILYETPGTRGTGVAAYVCVKRENKTISSVTEHGDGASALLLHKAVDSGDNRR